MSQDQKPARMRVVSGGTNTETAPAQRRRGDAADAVIVDAARSTKHVGPATTTPSTASRKTAAMLVLFLVCCAVGGALFPLIGVS